MNEEIMNKVNEIIDCFNKNDDIRRLKEIKIQIINNKDLIKKINELKSIDKYDSKYISLKEELIKSSLLKEYHDLENKLYFTILEINNKLSSLTKDRRCKIENN